MDWSRLLSYFQEGETTTTKFLAKAELESDIAPLMVAMANTNGGKIFIGVDVRNCHLVGTKQPAEWIHYVIYQCCKPAFQVGLEMIIKNDKHVLCITVPSGNHRPYLFEDACYLLDNGQIRLATSEEVREMDELKKLQQPSEPPEIPMTAFTQPFVHAEIKDAGDIQDTVQDHYTGVTIEYPVAVSPTQQVNDLTQTMDSLTARLTSRQKETLKYLQKQGSQDSESTIRNKTYRALFKVSHKTAHIELVDLVQRGYLVPQGSGRNTCYRLLMHQN
jgi:predicted HTH transcriptional regulator